MSVRVTETATVLALGRLDFAALLARQDPSAFRLKRRLASLFTARLRNQLRHLAGSLGGEVAGPPAEDAARAFAELEYCGPPDSRYVRRMATFHDFDPLALWGFLTSGSYARCPPGRTLLAEGAPSTACYLTINGAVEKVLVRGDRRIRVGLAGPGKAFGYESLIDGRPSPVTAITRERALLLVLPRDPFEQLFNGEDAVSRVFLDTACYLTINGAVEKVLVRGDRRIRVGLAGPGKAFGYESLIDGRPSPVTTITRERALLLVLPRDPFEQLFNGEDAGSRVFLDVIQRDLVATLRQTLRPHARLAASV